MKLLTAAEKRANLLAMPVGCKRPTRRGHPLGMPLCTYTEKTQGLAYNAKFDKAIRARQPQWFSPSPDEKKRLLLALKPGSPKPGREPPFGWALRSYTRKTGERYDRAFNGAIRKRQPQWFPMSPSEKKRRLLAMRPGCKRPAEDSPLGQVLMNYTRFNHSCYDVMFSIAIRIRQPGWFTRDSALHKKQLMEMPVGCKRPGEGHPLGRMLSSYTCKSQQCYDPKFRRELKKRQPGWFKNTKES